MDLRVLKDSGSDEVGWDGEASQPKGAEVGKKR